MIKFYMAGKIGKNDWRHDLCNGLRGNGFTEMEYKKTRSTLSLKNGNLYVGPWFVSCDHGCYHGGTKHGALNGCYDDIAIQEQYDYMDEHGGHTIYPRKYIKDACMGGIDRCDVLFAYIDSLDCYGTLAEIGYAYAKNKQIWVMYSNKLMHEMLKPEHQYGEFVSMPGFVTYQNYSEYNRTHEMWFIDELADKVGFTSHLKETFDEWCAEYK